ncbi:MAG: lytic murein transglycosylase B [Burkholderiales bacterium]
MRTLFCLWALLFSAGSAAAKEPSAPYAGRPEVRAFMQEMVQRHGFVERELAYIFARARRLEVALKAVATPASARAWTDYRATFVNDRQVGGGVDFWRQHRKVLERAAKEYGVPEEVIVAIIGIETFYGRHTGRWRVIDALTTLAFDYPPRAPFFRGELENYLLIARDTGTDVFSVRGSWAGAIGIPQFMPGSYLKFAVDFDGDGHVDLSGNPADAIGSVANFLKQHGWKPGEIVVLEAEVKGDAVRAYADGSVLPRHTLEELAKAGATPRVAGAPVGLKAALIELETPGRASEFRLGFDNFYVLTRYNRSSFYATAVSDLAAALRAARYPGGR